MGGDSGTGAGRQQMLYKKRPYEDKPPEAPTKVVKQGKAGGQARAYSVNQVTPKGTSE